MRTLPPARSPISTRSLLEGLGAVVSGRTPDLLATLSGVYSARAGMLTDSGTSALTLALRAAHENGMSPVALPAYGCFDLVTAAVGAATPVLFYDVDPATLGPAADSLSRVLEKGARTVVAAHFYGVPVAVDDLRQTCANHDALLIEDAAQEAGSLIAGRRAGSFGSLTILSFGRGKGLTGGSGGALLATDDRGTRLIDGLGATATGGRGLADVIGSSALWLLGRPPLFAVPRAIPGLHIGETIYKDPSPVTGMSRAARAIVSANMRLLEEELAVRRASVERLTTAIEGQDAIAPIRPARPDLEPGWLRLPVLLGPAARKKAVSNDAARIGVASGYPRPLDELAPIKPLLVEGSDLPGTARVVRELFTLPTHGWVSDGDMTRLEQWIGAL